MTAPLPKILVVDDEPQILRFLTYALQAAGYTPIQATRGQEALDLLRQHDVGALILDLGLPDMDGKTLIARLRPDWTVPIIVLSAHDQEAERIMALDLGADDFIAKPFGVGELLARLRACLRRHMPAPSPREIAGFALDPDAREAEIDGRKVKLTRKEAELLGLLAANAGRFVRHRQLLQQVWGPAHVEDVAYLRVFIGQLRKKLALEADSAVQIETEAGTGYRLMAKGVMPPDEA